MKRGGGFIAAAVLYAAAAGAASWEGSGLAAVHGLHGEDGRGAGGYTIDVEARARGEAWTAGLALRRQRLDADRADPDAPAAWQEGWLRYAGERHDLTLGRQRIVWGRTDGFRPTDKLSGRDYDALEGDDEAARLGVDALRLRVYPGADDRLEAILIAGAEPSRLPAVLRPPVPVDERGTETSARRPEWGLRYARFGRGLDFSLVHFDGHDRRPLFFLDGGALATQPPALRLTGLDWAFTARDWIVRGELARSRHHLPEAAVRFVQDEAVIGVENAPLENLRLIVQGLYTRNHDTTAAATPATIYNRALFDRFDRRLRGLSLTADARLRQDRLHIECSILWRRPRGDGALRAVLRHTLGDQMQFEAGWERFSGPPQSTYGLLEARSRAWLRLIGRWGGRGGG